MKNETEVLRKTKETDISVLLSLNDKQQNIEINTGVGFFDHMLTAFAFHSGISLKLFCSGDIEVDCHHTIEDCGIALGKAFSDALGDKSSISRFGSAYIPMDEALAFASVDISGRAFLVFNADFTFENIGDMATQMVEEFFRAFAVNAGITLHIKLEYGKNDHHKAEALFKATARALKEAMMPSGEGEILSTKGVI